MAPAPQEVEKHYVMLAAQKTLVQSLNLCLGPPGTMSPPPPHWQQSSNRQPLCSIEDEEVLYSASSAGNCIAAPTPVFRASWEYESPTISLAVKQQQAVTASRAAPDVQGFLGL
ncbi:hypothetical protein NDU88_000102 [Pleurodeles waltl]|uniref:Uncharacterized protein n=1 Tax=Pleurodeles waltl TaxID=8319 RepID=A0AAV7S782_PLEWA|nr:hypothetical protein NDU88_000102 [Pleurodeles waltl]